MTANILITGAAGFVGKNLITKLLNKHRSNEIRLLVAPWDEVSSISHFGCEIVKADIRNINQLYEPLKGIKKVYHLASKVSGENYNDFKDTIVNGTINILKIAKKNKIKKIIYFSSTGVYGMPATAGNVRNLSEASPMLFSEGYGKAKLVAEELIKKSKLKYLIIRPTTIYGPGDKAGIYQLISFASKFPLVYIGTGQNKMDYIHVEDLVDTVISLENKVKNNQEFIIGSGKPISQFELFNAVCEALNKPLPKIHIPTQLAIAVSSVIKHSLLLFGKNSTIHPNRVKVLTSDFYFDTHKVKSTGCHESKHTLTGYLKSTLLVNKHMNDQ